MEVEEKLQERRGRKQQRKGGSGTSHVQRKAKAETRWDERRMDEWRADGPAERGMDGQMDRKPELASVQCPVLLRCL